MHGAANRDGASETVALRALAAIVADPDLGPRFLDLTGLDVATLRARAGSPAVLAAVLDFLEGNEADLVAVAATLEISPAVLTRAHRALAGGAA